MRIYTGNTYEDKFYDKSYSFKNKLGKIQTNIIKGHTVTKYWKIELDDSTPENIL